LRYIKTMKGLGKIAVCLAGGLALNAGLRAASPASANHPVSANNPVPAYTASSDNPYAAIATRNIFGLLPPPAPEDPAKAAEKELPKITPTGIMGVNGHLQVLFKVAPAKPGAGAKDELYIWSEGQMQDDITVVKIDDKNNVVTFDNHGFTQQLPLAEAAASGGAAPSSSGGMNPGMAAGASGGNGGSGGVIRFGSGVGGNNGGFPNGNAGSNGGGPNGANGANGGLNFGNTAAPTQIYQPEASTLKPEESTILIEVERAKLMTDPHPAYSPNILPPTPLTKFNTTDGSILSEP
jgi:hypothetical protein